MDVYLKYVGGGSFLPGVPARDLSKDEAEEYGVSRLLRSGLYDKVRQKPIPSTNKLSFGSSENKEKE